MCDTKDLQRKQANDNPWYCLATLHGEQSLDGPFDQELATKNRTDRNRWIAKELIGAQREQLTRNFARRTSLALPDPDAIPDFSHTNFDTPAYFSDFQFPGLMTFNSATFSGDVNFQSARFLGFVDFTSATFSARTHFDGAHFQIYSKFKSATFSKEATFRSALFNEGVNFREASFCDKVDFQHATLSCAQFNSLIFPKDAVFKGTQFLGDATFALATFKGIADFSGAKFTDLADFGSTTFSLEADFFSATFHNGANFNAVTSFDIIRFINTSFVANTIFADARFRWRVPDFRGARMHEATEWHGVSWPKPPANINDAQQQVYAYERLKQEMERLKKHEDEQSFFRKELRARRGLVRAFSGGWLLNLAYQVSSDYGSSISMPLLWLFGVFATGVAVFSRAPLYCGTLMPIKLAAKLSFANIFVFLPDKREIMMNGKMVECLSNTTQAVSAVQTLLSVMLLFLLGLALRNRFRMK